MTLVEMLVVVGLLMIMMVAIVTIFQSATGAVNNAQVSLELDNELRRIDAIIRTDLNGYTGKVTPPLDPNDNLGYLEYGENQLSDLQEEDTDDYIAFTVKAPEGQPFVGRIWVNLPNVPAALPVFNYNLQQLRQPIMVTSNFAEVIYFLRNGNLYRRVLLVIDPTNSEVKLIAKNPALNSPPAFNSQSLINQGLQASLTTTDAVGWLAVNDISAHPGNIPGLAQTAVNQFAVPPKPNTLGDLTNRENRFARPRFSNDFTGLNAAALTLVPVPDGTPDDGNPFISNAAAQPEGIPDFYPTLYGELFNSPRPQAHHPYTGALLGFLARVDTAQYQVTPSKELMAFPYVYPGMYSKAAVLTGVTQNFHGMPFVTGSVRPNHAPVPIGDSLEIPTTATANLQTWWGFPTWRETASPNWTDPVKRLNDGSVQQADVLRRAFPFDPAQPFPVISLPISRDRISQEPTLFSDGAGNDTFFNTGGTGLNMPLNVWEDDLLASNVRSFNIKVYDQNIRAYDSGTGAFPASTGYVDLGYGSLIDTDAGIRTLPNFLRSFGHEGRIPPLVLDNRLDPNFPQNVGDDTVSVTRLQRVFDTWSTNYTLAPQRRLDEPNVSDLRPALPSYPAPYSLPLLGLEITVKVTDTRNERVRTLTIRHDFSDKL